MATAALYCCCMLQRCEWIHSTAPPSVLLRHTAALERCRASTTVCTEASSISNSPKSRFVLYNLHCTQCTKRYLPCIKRKPDITQASPQVPLSYSDTQHASNAGVAQRDYLYSAQLYVLSTYNAYCALFHNSLGSSAQRASAELPRRCRQSSITGGSSVGNGVCTV
jgi:hypothetical protein